MNLPPNTVTPSSFWAEQIEYLRGLAAIVREEGLSEIRIERDGVRLSLKAEAAAPALNANALAATAANALAANVLPLSDMEAVGAAEVASQIEAAIDAEAEAEAEAGLLPIVSPMVGVFYRAQSPDAPPLVEVGDQIEVGQEIGIIEAMKVFNEITSEVSGTLVEIRALNGELVEADGVLFLVRP